MAHARCSASAAYRWVPCPGSVDLSATLPEPGESEYAKEGTAAHEFAAMLLTAQAVVTEELYDVRSYVEYIRELGKHAEILIEANLTDGVLAKLHPDLGGTGDAIAIGPDWVEIVDLKYGSGVLVEAEENLQLKIYALGALLKAARGGIKEVRATIVQPRADHYAGPIRTWTFPASDLIEFAADLVEAAKRTVGSKELKAGTHCKFCPAAAVCPELTKSRTAMIAMEFGPVVDMVKLAQALDMIPQLEAQIKAVNALAYNEATRGNPPPGYKLVKKRPGRKWTEEQAIVDILGADQAYEKSLKSPAAIEKELGKKAYALVDKFVVKQSSGYTLVHASDKRPPVASATLEDFSAVGGTEDRKETNPPLISF